MSEKLREEVIDKVIEDFARAQNCTLERDENGKTVIIMPPGQTWNIGGYPVNTFTIHDRAWFAGQILKAREQATGG